MLSPVSSGFATGGGAGLFVTAGVGIGIGVGVCVGVERGTGFVVLQPANNANENTVAATATMLDFSENIGSFVTQPMATNKSAIGRDAAPAASPPA